MNYFLLKLGNLMTENNEKTPPNIQNSRISRVKVIGDENPQFVVITSSQKPEIPTEIVEKWQRILDLMAGIINVPAGLIMKLEEHHIGVFLSSLTDENPYEVGEKVELGTGLYCETVIGNNDSLLVPNALVDSYWKNNPDVPLGMISYLGVPIQWPDGEVFGTLCVLDNKANEFSDKYLDQILLLLDIIQRDLSLTMRIQNLENCIEDYQFLKKESK